MITDPLSKRQAGKPLSEAEHEQRVNAARSRWKDLAATGTGAAIAGGVTAATLGYAGRRQRAAIVSSHAPVLAAQAQTEARLNRHGNKEAQVNRGLSPRRRTFNENALKTLGSQVRQGKVAHRAILDSAKPELGQFNHDTNQVEPTWPEPQAREMQGLQERTQATQARIDDIRANGRPDRRVQVQAGRGAQVQPHERIVPENHVVWDRGAHERLAGLRQRFGHGETAQPEAGILRPARPADLAANQRIIDGLGNLRQGHNQHWLPQPHEARQLYSQLNTLDDLERMVRGMAGRARSAFLDRFGLPNFRRPRAGRGRAVQVAGGQRRGAQAHTRQVEGYPNFAARRQLSGELRQNVADRAWTWRGAEAKSGAWRTALAGMEARAAAFPHQQALRVLEHPGTRLAALGAAAVAGGIGAHLLAQHIWGQRELGKSADEQPDPDYFDQASAVEAKLARNLASALGNWKDSVADGAGMSGKMTADLTEALAPLGEAIQAGASAPMTLSGDPNGSRRLAFTLAARSPAPAEFIDAYRLDRVRELQQDQVDAVKSVLAAAARDGAAPAEMARRIRQTVGLTTNQASQVLNYRRDLERLDPNALQRSLRDQRFDSTVSTAIAKQTALPAAKIDQAVDAYHRRYLALRSTTIARTEALRAANNGHAAAMTELLNDQPGATVVKTWVATHDGRTRDSHRKLDGKSVVGMDTPFVCDDGSELLWPHDPDGSASETINCRCTFITHLIPTQVETATQETEDA